MFDLKRIQSGLYSIPSGTAVAGALEVHGAIKVGCPVASPEGIEVSLLCTSPTSRPPPYCPWIYARGEVSLMGMGCSAFTSAYRWGGKVSGDRCPYRSPALV